MLVVPQKGPASRLAPLAAQEPPQFPEQVDDGFHPTGEDGEHLGQTDHPDVVRTMDTVIEKCPRNSSLEPRRHLDLSYVGGVGAAGQGFCV